MLPFSRPSIGEDEIREVTEVLRSGWVAQGPRVAAFEKPAVDPKPSLFSGRLPGNTRLAEALRVGRGKLRWPSADV